MPKVSEEYALGMREQILEAAIRLFSRNGFHSTGMAEIIKEAGLSAGGVYRYYKSKDELIAAIIERMVSGMEAQLVQATQGVTSLDGAVTACLQFALQVRSQTSEEGERLLPQVWTEALRNPEIAAIVSKKYDAVLGHFSELVERLQREGQADRSLNPDSVASMIISVVQGYGLQQLLLGRKLDDQAYLNTLTQLLA